jgi:hypothetical protein
MVVGIKPNRAFESARRQKKEAFPEKQEHQHQLVEKNLRSDAYFPSLA